MSYKKTFLVIIFFVFFTNLFCQNGETDWWYFGGKAGLHFSDNTVQYDTNSAMNAMISCASISDNKGQLLFYTNGDYVWNKDHLIMENGDTISNQNASYPFNYSYVSVIIPNPANKKQYYIFSIDNCVNNPSTLYYSIIDLTYNNGLGKVISKQNILFNNVVLKLTAVQHTNKQSFWVITHLWNSKNYISFKISKNGIENPVYSNTGDYLGVGQGGNSIGWLSHKGGYLRISPRGDLLVHTIQTNPPGSSIYGRKNVELLDFSCTTGKILFRFSIALFYPTGAEFSSNGNVLYVVAGAIFQMNLASMNDSLIKNSIKQIATTGNTFYSLQLAKNNKIYAGQGSTLFKKSKYVAVINNPDVIGVACNFIDSGKYLGGRNCQEGLPIFIQSYFFKPDFEAIGTCFSDTTQFYVQDSSQVDSLFWIFDDSISGSNNFSNSWI
ncbi:MAG: hypothetical protein U9R42_12115, partial [Bacteroidota bacterium]|nr:hypothetical protein [Bacteroidota bacterium]